MKQCLLCQNKDADNTGSHVVPHFLLKRIFNEEFAKDRDKEIEFHLTSFDVETHFGRSILPEKKDEIMGELTEEERAEITFSRLVVDNEWCKTCESKFAKLESNYSSTLKKVGSGIYQSMDSGIGPMMFWLSIFWRTSATGRMGFSMQPGEQEILRTLLNEYNFEGDDKGYSDKKLPGFGEIRYKVIRSADYGRSGSTFSFLAHLRRPYAMIVDDFVVFLYMKKKHLANREQMFFDFEKIENVPVNTNLGGEIIFGLDHKTFGASMEKVVEFTKNVKLRFYDQKINELFKRFKYSGPYKKEMRDEIVGRVANDSKSIGKKYTLETFSLTATEVFSKYLDELNRR